MVDVNELFDSATPMAGDLVAGLKTLALDQKIKFKLYGRVVLPVDGFVFWVRADLLAQSIFTALVTAEQLAEIEESGDPPNIEVMGSLHYGAEIRQEEAETYSQNRVVFTTPDEVQMLDAVAPGTMWIGEFDGLRFGFSSVSSRYKQAGLWHYSGFAIYADVGPNVIDSVLQFSSAQVVSNSLPAWLALATYKPAWAFWGSPPTLFPSFLVPLNEPPPFAAVHVYPESTVGLAMAPTIDRRTSTHTQLCSERVKVTLWGTRNTNALDFIDMVNQYTLDTDAFGIMNIPVTRDEKRTQAELGVVAMKKSIDFEISYLQHRMNQVGQQVIKSAIPNFIVAK